MDRFRMHIDIILMGLSISKEKKNELEEELRYHLEMSKKELINAGYSENESEIIAIEKFGEIDNIRSKFKKIFTPYKRIKSTIINNKFAKEALGWTATILGAVILSLFIRSYAFASTEVRQCSMQNTLFEGQHLIENKMQYYFSKPQRGDIVIINQNTIKGVFNIYIDNLKSMLDKFSTNSEYEKTRLIKRVIGIPGDTVDIKNGSIYLNKQLYNEPYVKGITMRNGMEFPVTIPDNEYFVLGDNRENSSDSRQLGFIKMDNIEGKAILRFWPLDKFGSISN